MRLLVRKYISSFFCLLVSALNFPLVAQIHDSANVDKSHLVKTANANKSVAVGRKKVGVVLSGGGAKGAAHVSVLKAIEDAGIPIDYIVGTSMGSIVGGLYAYGYSTQQLDSLFRSQEWMNLLLNELDRNHRDFKTREISEKYMLTIPAFRNGNKHLKGGVLSGEAVLNLFKALTPDCPDSMSFADLKIPFACVAVDIVTGNEIDMTGGNLATSIRSSMSIPCVFSPIHRDGMVLVDGGISNNYPVDIAKKLGADVIIGVTLDSENGENTADDIVTPLDVIGQMMSNITDHKVDDNLKITDLHINVNTEGFSSASFSTDAIETLLKRGKEAGDKHRDDLIAFRNSLGLNKSDLVEPMPGRDVPKEADDVIREFDYGCTLGGGLRIDSEELAAVILGGIYRFHSHLKPSVGAQLRLGSRIYGKTNLTFNPIPHWTVDGTYKFSYNEIKLYSKGKRVLDWDFHEQFARLSFYRTWNMMKITVAADYAKRNYDQLLSSADYVMGNDFIGAKTYRSETDINYYASARFDNRDARVFPHKGSTWTMRFTYVTNDGSKYDNGDGLPVGELYFEKNVPLSERITMVPALWGRFVFTDQYLKMGDRNMIGGVACLGHYLPQQLPFAGVNHVEAVSNKFAAAGLTCRGRLGDNHFIYGLGNFGCNGNLVKDLLDDTMFGVAVGYGYKTPVGPAELNFNWSNVTDKVGLWLSFGYMF